MTSGTRRGRARPRNGQAADVAPAGDVTIDFDRYVPTVLSRVVSRLRTNANAFFQETYGLSLLEWRVVSALGAQGSMSAYAIWTEGGLDKAAVSRALKALRARDLVVITEGPALDSRRRTSISLTAAGRHLHEQTLATVIARHARLVAGIGAADLDALLRTLDKLEAGIAAMAGDAPADPALFPITRRRTD